MNVDGCRPSVLHVLSVIVMKRLCSCRLIHLTWWWCSQPRSTGPAVETLVRFRPATSCCSRFLTTLLEANILATLYSSDHIFNPVSLPAGTHHHDYSSSFYSALWKASCFPPCNYQYYYGRWSCNCFQTDCLWNSFLILINFLGTKQNSFWIKKEYFIVSELSSLWHCESSRGTYFSKAC